MSRTLCTLALGAVLVTASLAGTKATAQEPATTDQAVELFRAGERAAQPQATTDDAAKLFRSGERVLRSPPRRGNDHRHRGGERRMFVTELLERLSDAHNRHDLDAFVACFDPGYRSEQPVHPGREFSGSEQVRANWAEIFAGVPDFRAELLRSAHAGGTRWAEWHWHGTRGDGSRLDIRGVTIFELRDDRIVWGRLYLEYVEGAAEGIDQAVRRMSQGTG
jgi:hypothetical protein